MFKPNAAADVAQAAKIGSQVSSTCCSCLGRRGPTARRLRAGRPSELLVERYAALVGRYSASDVRAFLRGVLRGSIGTAPLRSPLNLEAADCAAVHAAKQAPVEEEDALDDDFMAELLAEEAAAKKALEEEAAAESKRLKEELEASKKKPDAPKKKKKKKKKKKSSEL